MCKDGWLTCMNNGFFGAFLMVLVLVCDDWHKCFIRKLEAKFVWAAEGTPGHYL